MRRGSDAPATVLYPWALLALIVAVGAALRLYGLDHQSLWNDELSSWSEYHVATWREVLASVSRYHPPGYWLLMHGWIGWVGDGEIQLRLPSAFAGIAAIPAMFALGRRLYGPAEGLIAASLTATTWPAIFFSQEARAYMFVFLFVVLCTSWLIVIVGALREARRPPAGAVIGYVLTAAAACYCHYGALLVVILQALLAGALCLRRRVGRRYLAVTYALILLAYAPWLVRVATDLSGGPAWLTVGGTGAPWIFFHSLLSNSTPLILAVVATLLVAVVAHSVSKPRRFRNGADALLLAWLVVPLAILSVRSLLVSVGFTGRHAVIVLPAAYLLVARGMTQLPLRGWGTPLVATALPVLLVFHLVFVQAYFTRPGTEQFREAAAYLVQHDTPGARVLVLACAWNRIYFDYYLERLGSVRRVDRVAETPDDRVMIEQLLAQRSPATVWLLAGHKQPAAELVAWLGDELRLVAEAHYRAAEVWQFVPRDPAR